MLYKALQDSFLVALAFGIYAKNRQYPPPKTKGNEQ
jgi:hypothetical protein